MPNLVKFGWAGGFQQYADMYTLHTSLFFLILSLGDILHVSVKNELNYF